MATTESIRRVERAANSKGWPRLDYILAVTIGALLVIGLIMVYSSTFDTAYQWNDGQSTYYLVRQVLFAVFGLVLLLILARLDYTHLHRISIPLMGLTLALLVLVLFLGKERFGAVRSFANGSLQPSELAKLAVVIYIADWLASKGDKIRDVSYGLIPFGVLIGVIAGLIVREPDFSTAVLIVATAGTMFFLAGADLGQLIGGSAVASVTFGVLVMSTAHGRERILSFIKTFSDPAQASWQLQQSLIALGSGGLMGRGLGVGQQKLGILPLAHTDSIFAVIGEEMGLVGCLIIVGLFAALAYRGFKIAAQAPDAFGALLAAGATSWLVFQAAFNIASVTGLLPMSGIPLPFISYGGSSLVTSMGAVGILLSVSRGTRRPLRARQGSATLDFGRRDRRPRLSRVSSR
jgi:cell division protein FtsW